MPPNQDNRPTAKVKEVTPDASEFGQLRSYLARLGVKQADITTVIGTGAQGRTRLQIAAELRGWLAARPKA